MQVKSFIMGVVLVAGLLAGCGGMEADAELGSAPAGDESAEVSALGCSDCGWLWLRCMKRAVGPEAQAQCDESRAVCEETFCFPAAPPVESASQVEQASACSDLCDARLNTCLRLGTTHMLVCFERHDNCMMNCPIEE